MTANSGYSVNQQATYAASYAASGATGHVEQRPSFGQFDTGVGGTRFSYTLAFVEYDSSLLAATPDKLYIGFNASVPLTVHCAAYDYGNGPFATPWRTPTQLAALTVHASFTLAYSGGTSKLQVFEFPLTGLTIGALWRFVFYTDDQKTATAPTTSVNSVVNLNTGLIAKYNNPGATATTWAAEVAADSPTLWWRLNEPSGTAAADNSGNGHGGTYTNTPTLNATGLTADGDKAIVLSQASNNYVVSTDDFVGSNVTGGLTVEVAVKIATADIGGSSGYSVFAGFENGYEYDITIQDVDEITGKGMIFLYSQRGSGTYRWALGFLVADAPCHIIGVWPTNGLVSGMRLYVNGDCYQTLWPDDSGIALDFTASGQNLFVGSDGGAGDGTTGTVDEAAFYLTALSPSRAAVHYKAFSSPSTPPAPTCSSVTPNHGYTTGGDSVVLAGTHLTGATEVDFGTTPAAAFTVNSDSQITATTPPHAEGTVNVTVTTPGGTSA